ncbi:Aminoglycoside phosphotransferase [Penicillium digitatum]|nr:Aminoglycoside phosphotransferase [Penicillium digitatum]
MARKRHLLRREVTYEDVKDEEFNILHQLEFHGQQLQFFTHLWDKRDWMKTVVAHHLNLASPSACEVSGVKDWLYGSFNVCVPITINYQHKARVLLRFPLPYRVGEAFNPGNGDEKIRCEAATYAWLQENCSDIPIPQLYGFSLSSGEVFTFAGCMPLFSRFYFHMRRRLLLWLGRPIPSNYTRHQYRNAISIDGLAGISTGYILVEFVDKTKGQMLSNTWSNGRHDPILQTNLFRDLSRIFLSLFRSPLPRIGSLSIDNYGYLHVSNRPLSVEIQQLENEGICTDMSREYTYSTVDSYLTDLLGVHDNRFRFQPNAVNNLGDCAYQLSVLSAMRTVSQSIFSRTFRRGPFVLCFTDLHQSNIFVSDQWQIKCLVDLEWACSRPIEMVIPPYWLTDKGVDEIIPEEYDAIRRIFMETLVNEEEKPVCDNLIKHDHESTALRLSEIMNKTWDSGAFWYTIGISSPSGLFNIFNHHIKPLFCAKDYDEDFGVVMPFFFDKNVGAIAARKLADKEKYDEDLQRAFNYHAKEE